MSEHDVILSLAKAAFDAEHSPQWKTDFDAAFERHGDACDALWNELRRQVEGKNIEPAKSEAATRRETIKEVRREIIDACKNAIDAALADMK